MQDRLLTLELKAEGLERSLDRLERGIWRIYIFLLSVGGGAMLILVRHVLNNAGISL